MKERFDLENTRLINLGLRKHEVKKKTKDQTGLSYTGYAWTLKALGQ